MFSGPVGFPAIQSDVVSAAWRGGDRRPDGAEAPPQPGRSSRVRDSGRATPYAVRQGEMRGGRPAEKNFPSEKAAVDGVGGCRGQGAGKPLPPAPRRGGDHARGPGRSRRPRQCDSAQARVPLHQTGPHVAYPFFCLSALTGFLQWSKSLPSHRSVHSENIVMKYS